jgi:hypothetical protein
MGQRATNPCCRPFSGTLKASWKEAGTDAMIKKCLSFPQEPISVSLLRSY